MSRHITTVLRSATLASIALAAITACQTDAPVAPANLPGPRSSSANVPVIGRPPMPKPQLYFNGILFVGTHDHPKGEIYSMNPDGSGMVRLTNDTLLDVQPDASPNGPAFIWVRFSPDGKTSELYTQNLDGTKRKQLTSLGTLLQTPRYSPDGTRIAFTAFVPGSGGEIFTMNADGTDVARMTHTADNSQFPSWSPDGSRIAYQSWDSAGFSSVWTMYASGSVQTHLASCLPRAARAPSGARSRTRSWSSTSTPAASS
jgi:Tol biopolymer transport system component